MTNIFIANLDWEITSEDLKTTFTAFGPVSYAHVVYEPNTRRSRGYGYVEMEVSDHAINAIQALNGMEVNGRRLDVKIASPKGNRPPKKEAEAKKPFEKKPGFKSFGQKPHGDQTRFERKPRFQNEHPNPRFNNSNDQPKRKRINEK